MCIRDSTWYPHKNGTHLVMKGLRKLIQETRPDIIHCVMEPWSLTCLEVLALLAGSRQRPKFGVHAAETRLDQGRMLSTSLRRRLFREVVSRCDFFIGWSPQVLEAARSLGLNGQPACAAPGVGVDITLFQPPTPDEKARIRQELNLAGPEDFLVGFVGRFVEEKGIMDLVTAVENAVREAPQLRLALLGEGPLRPRLVAIAAQRPWLRLRPRTDRSGVTSFLRALNLLVVPSRSTPKWEEQFGLVIAEAMACGIPVAGAACGAIPHVIGDDRWVFPQGSPEAIQRCILGAAADPNASAAGGRTAGQPVSY